MKKSNARDKIEPKKDKLILEGESLPVKLQKKQFIYTLSKIKTTRQINEDANLSPNGKSVRKRHMQKKKEYWYISRK